MTQLNWLTMPEVLKRLGISRNTLHQWRACGYFPPGIALNPAATRLRWDEQEVIAWMRARPVSVRSSRSQHIQRQLGDIERQAAGLPPRPKLLPKSERGR